MTRLFCGYLDVGDVVGNHSTWHIRRCFTRRMLMSSDLDLPSPKSKAVSETTTSATATSRSARLPVLKNSRRARSSRSCSRSRRFGHGLSIDTGNIDGCLSNDARGRYPVFKTAKSHMVTDENDWNCCWGCSCSCHHHIPLVISCVRSLCID